MSFKKICMLLAIISIVLSGESFAKRSGRHQVDRDTIGTKARIAKGPTASTRKTARPSTKRTRSLRTQRSTQNKRPARVSSRRNRGESPTNRRHVVKSKPQLVAEMVAAKQATAQAQEAARKTIAKAAALEEITKATAPRIQADAVLTSAKAFRDARSADWYNAYSIAAVSGAGFAEHAAVAVAYNALEQASVAKRAARHTVKQAEKIEFNAYNTYGVAAEDPNILRTYLNQRYHLGL